MGCLDVRGDGSRVSLLELNELVVMQYTGLNDKKGLEIFEGDLIDCYNFRIGEVKYDRVLMEVTSQTYMGFYLNRDDKYHTSDGSFEIVDNVYEIRRKSNYTSTKRTLSMDR